MPSHLIPARRAALCLLPLGLVGCALFDHSSKVTLASDPPGARVLIAGRDCGFVTPCVLELDPSEPATIALELGGYELATRVLVPDTQRYAMLWRDMHIRNEVWNFPLWLNMRDTFVPVKINRRLSPARIFVRLERTADQ